jgi:hypothetical protein
VWLAQKDSLAAIAFTELSELSKPIAGRRSRSANDEVELGDLNEPRSLPAEWSFPKAYNESIADQRRANYCYLPKRLSARVPAPFASLLDGASSFVFPLGQPAPDRRCCPGGSGMTRYVKTQTPADNGRASIDILLTPAAMA